MNQLGGEKGIRMLIKASDTTDPRYGCDPKKRSIEEHINKGVINIDKPAGPTSHEVVAWIKNILDLDKAGHSGTLDPKVTGVLPVMLGGATKAVGALLAARKGYVCVMRLHRTVPEERIREVCREFTGDIYQRPPLKSAVKRQIRKRKIHQLRIREIKENEVLFEVDCEAGTYIRKLCHDIGAALGVGAHMAKLRRTVSGPFTEDAHIATLQDLKDAHVFWKEDDTERPIREIIMPMEYGVSHLSKVIIRDTAVDAICHGADLAVPGVLSVQSEIEMESSVAVFTLKGECVCLGTAKMNTIQILGAKDGIAVDTDRVLMEPGIYPKAWKSRPVTGRGHYGNGAEVAKSGPRKSFGLLAKGASLEWRNQLSKLVGRKSPKGSNPFLGVNLICD